MKRVVAVVAALLFLVTVLFSQMREINVIPKPSSVEAKTGHFTLDQKTQIVVRTREDRAIAETLKAYLSANYGLTLKISSGRSPMSNIIHISDGGDHFRLNDGYGLWVENNRIAIEASSASGRFYALQTLIQLLPTSRDRSLDIPAVAINDSARFRYRGMHLDVARHFQPVEFVKKFIDLMARYKFNYFHWHLTEDQGWRIEIKKYPKLTEIGSMRPETHEGAHTSTPYHRRRHSASTGFTRKSRSRDVVEVCKGALHHRDP